MSGGNNWWTREKAQTKGWRTCDVVNVGREPYGKPDERGEQKRRYAVELKTGEKIFLATVTTLLSYIAKPGLENWMIDQTIAAVQEQWLPDTAFQPTQIAAALEFAKKARWRKMSEAAGYGTRVHNIVDGFLRGYGWPVAFDAKTGVVEDVYIDQEPLQVQNSLQLWLEWWNKENLSVIETEGFVYNLEQGYAGTYDFLAENATAETILIDWKTSKDIYDTHALQLVAYGGALAAMGKGLPDKALCLCVSKEADQFSELYVWQSPEEFRQLWTRWCGLLGIKDLQDIVSERKRSHRVAQRLQKAAS